MVWPPQMSLRSWGALRLTCMRPALLARTFCVPSACSGGGGGCHSLCKRGMPSVCCCGAVLLRPRRMRVRLLRAVLSVRRLGGGWPLRSLAPVRLVLGPPRRRSVLLLRMCCLRPGWGWLSLVALRWGGLPCCRLMVGCGPPGVVGLRAGGCVPLRVFGWGLVAPMSVWVLSELGCV